MLRVKIIFGHQDSLEDKINSWLEEIKEDLQSKNIELKSPWQFWGSQDFLNYASVFYEIQVPKKTGGLEH